MSERKSGTSSATNLDMFMSRSVRIMRKTCGAGGGPEGSGRVQESS
jgi:hypothetical protein